MPDSKDDPRNWPPLRQRLEALKKMRELREGPRERISEAMVREAIADQYGIKPEDVTWKQIRFEMSDLLRHYPAITFVPSGDALPKDDSPDISNDVEPSTEITYENERRAFVIPLLDKKGWSILEWAIEAGVAQATAIDYLDKKTNPFRSTRLKLAKALGVDVEQLPK